MRSIVSEALAEGLVDFTQLRPKALQASTCACVCTCVPQGLAGEHMCMRMYMHRPKALQASTCACVCACVAPRPCRRAHVHAYVHASPQGLAGEHMCMRMKHAYVRSHTHTYSPGRTRGGHAHQPWAPCDPHRCRRSSIRPTPTLTLTLTLTASLQAILDKANPNPNPNPNPNRIVAGDPR